MTRWLLIAGLAACADPPALPEVGTWTSLTGNPDLGALTSPSQQPVDFGIWQAHDGSWHIWECIRYTMVPGMTRLFYGWHAAELLGPWTADGIVMQADTSAGETEGGLQAPFVLVDDAGQYRMFYGAWDHICAQASSDGGDTFARTQCPLFSDTGSNPRDPMVLREGNHWVLYYTAAVTDPDGDHGHVYARTSSDLAAWSDPITVAYGGAAGTSATSTECPFVVHRSDGYYLFRTQQYGPGSTTDVYLSPDPLMFGIDDDRDRLGTLPVAAPEIFDFEGKTYIAALELGTNGIRIAQLRW